jgi:uncharacterized protein (UPF0548 family)
MPSFRKPRPSDIRDFLEQQRRLGFSYDAVGATAGEPPSGFTLDHTRVEIGYGEQLFSAARAALTHWRQFELGWIEAWPTDTPLQAGETVAVIARIAGLWWLNAARIVYVLNEHAPSRRFGFAYGTLPGHAECGEERFQVEIDASERVWYDIVAFSRPRHLLARMAYPYTRRMQKRFARDSAAMMQAATRSR